MQVEDKIALSKARLESAQTCLSDSQTLIESGGFKSSANRSYYAVFHAVRAVLALDGIDSQKHSGVIAEFRRRYIKTGVFDNEISAIIGSQFDIRAHSDYDDFFIISKEDTIRQLQEAQKLVNIIKTYLAGVYIKGAADEQP